MTQITRRGVLTPLGIELAEAYETRSLSEVAKEYGVAKRSITEAFKTHYGMTKDEWWQQHKGRIYRPGRPFTYWDRDTQELTAEGAELSAYMETHSLNSPTTGRPSAPGLKHRKPRGIDPQGFFSACSWYRVRSIRKANLDRPTQSPIKALYDAHMRMLASSANLTARTPSVRATARVYSTVAATGKRPSSPRLLTRTPMAT